MIKATAHREDGTRIMLLGLSTMNLTKLREGLPISFSGKPFGFDGEVIILWGETEQSIADDMRKAGIAMPAAEAWPRKEPHHD